MRENHDDLDPTEIVSASFAAEHYMNRRFISRTDLWTAIALLGNVFQFSDG